MRMKPLYACFGLMMIGATEAASAQPSFASYADPVWDLFTIYEAEDTNDKLLHKARIIGRYHGQYYYVKNDEVKSDRHDDADDWEHRRQILGAALYLAGGWKIKYQFDVVDPMEFPIYDETYEASLNWKNKAGDHKFQLGRLDFLYTGMERSTSSKKMEVIERAMLANQTGLGEVVGVWNQQEVYENLSLGVGVWSGTIGDHFSDFDAGIGGSIRLQYKTPTVLGFDGTVKYDHTWHDGDDRNDAFDDYRHVMAIYYEGKRDRLDVGVEYLNALGIKDTPDVWGTTLLVNYTLFKGLIFSDSNFQINSRLHYAEGDGDDSLGGQKRYEEELPGLTETGDKYISAYLGGTYYIYENKLKLMGGVEWAHLYNDAPGEDDFKGTTVFFGVRTYWD